MIKLNISVLLNLVCNKSVKSIKSYDIDAQIHVQAFEYNILTIEIKNFKTLLELDGCLPWNCFCIGLSFTFVLYNFSYPIDLRYNLLNYKMFELYLVIVTGAVCFIICHLHPNDSFV